MDLSIKQKVDRINELYKKTESGLHLDNNEYNEQVVLREEIMNYFKTALLQSAK